ncbi:MAG: CoA ester lyase [Sphingomonadaceae bacterium]|nr:MAG: CoA ester lyase [Sphingomonadaceae bacterium]
MHPRSWLLAPADSETKLAKVPGIDAGAVVLDLSSVAEDCKKAARQNAVEFLAAYKVHGFSRWVRINPIGSPHWKEDLVAVMAQQPHGIILPRATGAQQVQLLAAEIYELEPASGCAHNSVRIIPQVGDTPESAFAIEEFAHDPHPRILGLSWDLQALVSAAHMTTNDNDVTRNVRARILLAAKARRLLAIESASGLVKRKDALEMAVRRARATGFDAMLARHPAQVPVIEDVFAPDDTDRAAANTIVSTFALYPDAQIVTVGGRSIDRTALQNAQRLLDDG